MADLLLDPSDPRGYLSIKALAKRLRCAIPDLLALHRSNDPFYAGSPASLLHAQWFADLWRACGYEGRTGIHLRRMHYLVVSTFHDLMTADTTTVSKRGTPSKPYTNTEASWVYLQNASAVARALELVDPTAFEDHRNPLVADVYEEVAREDPTLDWYEGFYSWRLPGISTDLGVSLDFTIPEPAVHGYGYRQRDQPYLLEIWVEKSTMETVLAPLVSRYGVRVVPSIGFQSITNSIKLLRRVARVGKPARVFYLSDFDPAGDDMPMAVARQLEFWRDRFAPESDIKLTPVCLTREQVQQYQLPRIPIRDSDLRKGRFEEIYGEGAVELDALEALYPGELRRLLSAVLAPYVDDDLAERLNETAEEADEQVQEAWTQYIARIQDEIDTTAEAAKAVYARYQPDLERLDTQLNSELEPHRVRLDELRAQLEHAQETFAPDLPDRPEPDVDPGDEAHWLYASVRSYLEQLPFYKARRNGHSDEARAS